MAELERDGGITKEEAAGAIAHWADENGVTIPQEAWDMLEAGFDAVDANGDGELTADELQEAFSEEEAAASRRRCSGALFGEPADVLDTLRRIGLQVVGAVAFQGHAVWSSMQLLAEIARGSWCLAQASSEELAVASPLEDREEVWQAIWNSRNLLRRTPVAPHCEDSATAGCRCVIS